MVRQLNEDELGNEDAAVCTKAVMAANLVESETEKYRHSPDIWIVSRGGEGGVKGLDREAAA